MHRNGAIDLLKFLSIFGIVWFHARAPGMNVAYSGLVCFVILSAYFSAGNQARPGYLAKRAAILGYPWIAWWLFYAALNITLGRQVFSAGEGPLVLQILAGPMLHLWYLPFMILGTLALVLLGKWSVFHQTHYGPMLFALAAFASVPASYAARNLWAVQLPAPLPQWIHAIPALLIGALFQSLKSRPPLLKAAVSLPFSAAFLYAALAGDAGLGIPYLLGINLTLACMALDGSDFRIPKAFEDLTMGIYLIHVFGFIVVRKTIVHGDNPALLAVATFSLSAAFVFVMKRSRLPVLSKIL